MANRIILRDLSDLAPYLDGDAPLPIGRKPAPIRYAEMRPAIIREPSNRAELIERVSQLKREGYVVRVDEQFETANDYACNIEEKERFNEFNTINWS